MTNDDRRNNKRDDALRKIQDEEQNAEWYFPKIASYHEGYAVLLRETEVLWEEIKKTPYERRPREIEAKAIHIAATALRFIIDLC